MNILSNPHGLHMVRKSTCQCRQFNYCNQICQVKRQNLKLYKCCWHGFNIIQMSNWATIVACKCVAMWEETGVNFFSSQVCLMCAGVNDIINNLHLVNTISKPTQNFSICTPTTLQPPPPILYTRGSLEYISFRKFLPWQLLSPYVSSLALATLLQNLRVKIFS